jgi:hypothetical protein
MVTEMMKVQLRSLPLHGEWSLPHHLRRMLGHGEHSRIRANVLMTPQ